MGYVLMAAEEEGTLTSTCPAPLHARPSPGAMNDLTDIGSKETGVSLKGQPLPKGVSLDFRDP